MFRNIVTASHLAFASSRSAAPRSGGNRSRTARRRDSRRGGDPTRAWSTPTPWWSRAKRGLQFRGGEIYAAMLSLGAWASRASELCRELGLYDCAGDVHRISLLRRRAVPHRDHRAAGEHRGLHADRGRSASRCRRARRVARESAYAPPVSEARSPRGALSPARCSAIRRSASSRTSRSCTPRWRRTARIRSSTMSWAAMSCFAIATTSEALFY